LAKKYVVVSLQRPRRLPQKAARFGLVGGPPGQKSGQPTLRNVPCPEPPFKGQFFNAYWLQTLIVNSVGWSAFRQLLPFGAGWRLTESGQLIARRIAAH